VHDARATLDEAVKLHQAGRIADAAAAYRRVLESSPRDPNALHLLGVTAMQSGRLEEAAKLIGQAIEIQPNVGTYHLNLAIVMRMRHRVDDAIAESEKAIALDPKLAAAGYHTAAGAFADDKQYDDAIFCLNKSLEADADLVQAHVDLGHMYDAIGRNAEGDAARDAAVAAAQRLIEREPNSAQHHLTLGHALDTCGRAEEATAEFRTASRLAPADPAVFHAFGTSLQHRGQRDEATMCFRVALRSNPDFMPARIGLSRLLDEQGNALAAAEGFRAVIKSAGDLPEAHAGLAESLIHLGEVDEGIVSLRAAVRLAPAAAHRESELLAALHYSPRYSPQDIYDAHAAWREHHAAEIERSARPAASFPNVRDPDRPLVIGLVSAHFRRSPTGRMLQAVIEHHDRARFFCVCYSNTYLADDLTDHLKKQAGGWRHAPYGPDGRVVTKVRDDAVDVLIDTDGHAYGNRLLAFAHRLAPVQMTHFGYPDTTGLTSIDYRVTDARADPSGTTEQWSSEKLLRLGRADLIYSPEADVPISAMPAGATLPITFGCVAPTKRVSSAAVALWARVLEAVPRSRLFIAVSHRDTDYEVQRLKRLGIDPARLRVVSRRDWPQPLTLFNNMDVALDALPYTARTTTCDALWMGVPVITLAGQTPAQRRGAGALTQVGLGDLAVPSADEYVRVAAALAEDRARLADLRKSLRETVRNSSLCDYAGYVQELQSLWRRAWRDFCST
jgi:predicted O-linked N-acetylglucosamine transferase (SPINDLY family)